MKRQTADRTQHLFVTGSRTMRGGRASHVATKAEYRGMAPARVGDTLTPDDGTEATNIDGAASAALWDNTPFALVGSRLCNGDTITDTAGVVESDRVPYLCGESRVLAGLNPGCFYEDDSDSASASRAAQSTVAPSAGKQFDEQFAVLDGTGRPNLGACYSIQRETDSSVHGRTCTAGPAQRLTTASRAGSVHIYVARAASVAAAKG
ncbi:hypothetical protein [Paraburkholderia solisilvae]|uniref:Uncharacterized protein n=1 Tax=Paraburkholderia solisilvae TaxID=624376 RepID=A0A6J5ECP8_9BURK|nr:hypothetical protein [Paraburkholderia solisilvae]CAB3764249.1 hypothetical protein LMG29739_04290 [Paraburkholderia solisilvae]